jgi:hypothetical protein
MRGSLQTLAWLACLLCATSCDSDPDRGSRTGSPADALPPHIRQLLPTGLRPDWSADGRRLLYLDALVGDVFELELATRAVRPLTQHFSHHGFTRARYLANGDLLLCGPRAADASQPQGGRWHTELWWLPGDLSGPAVALDAPCFEGPAVSRRSLRIAWTQSDYPEKVVFARSEIWTGRIVVEAGTPLLVERRKRLDRSAFHYLAFLETQDYRPPDERELIFTAYAHRGGEVMGLDLETGALTNYSQSWGYDEAEGVSPDGRWLAVEREPDTYTLTPRGHIDIWRTALDGSGASVRLTHFSDFAGYGANNPVVSPEGRWMAFGLREAGGPHGNGHGIFLLDLRAVSGR